MIKRVSFAKDAYIEMHGSRCLRTKQGFDIKHWKEGDRTFVIGQAMEECSKNKRCIGIEKIEGHVTLFKNTKQPAQITVFKACLDSIYHSTAWDKYENSTSQLFKKVGSYGMYRT